MIEVEIRAGAKPYAFRAGPGLLETVGPALRELGLGARVALIADATVHAHWGEAVLRSLAASSIGCLPLQIPAGEASKSLRQAEALYGALIDRGFDRGDTVVSLGGGVAGDLAGFVAATYHRGVAFVQLPTTLLAQVDASVGGKVAVDHPRGKNLIGAFHQPRLVLADTSTIATLPTRDRWSGLAEVVKAALIADGEFLAWLEAHLEELAAASPTPLLEEAIARAVRIKAAVVEADERELGLRRILNFGHTIGHALEFAAGYEHITHGEAVIAGMRAAVVVSERLGLPPAEAARASKLLARFPRPPPFPLPSRGELVAAVGRDKKAQAGAIRFVILASLGRARVAELSPALLSLAIDAALEA